MIYGGNGGKGAKNIDRDLIAAVATAKNKWQDWHIAHDVKGPF
jgi:hypothetical protein